MIFSCPSDHILDEEPEILSRMSTEATGIGKYFVPNRIYITSHDQGVDRLLDHIELVKQRESRTRPLGV